ncbi:16524_t:CDS:2, partial [Acaulospora morrowiae]
MLDQRIYAFGYNGFGQTNPETRDVIISSPTDITEITNCNKIIWANMNVTLGEMRDINSENKNPLMLWGFNPIFNEISLPKPTEYRNVKKCFGDDDGIQGFLDLDGNLHYIDLDSGQINVSNFPMKFVDIAQFWTGKDVVGITMDGKLLKWNLRENLTVEEIIMQSKYGLDDYFFTNVTCGENHCLALTQDGEVFSWGSGRYGQLGHGDISSLDKPKVIEFFQGLKISQIMCGGWHSTAISDSGDLYTFGYNHMGRLGIPQSEMNANLVNYAEPSLIEIGDDTNVLKVTYDYRLWTCGWGKYGQQGQAFGKLSDKFFFSPVLGDSNSDGIKIIDCYC